MKRMVFILLSACFAVAALAGCANGGADRLPAPSPDAGSQFGVDANINMDTIDSYIGRDDVAYRDVRMLFDPADYAAIGGEADLGRTIVGFKVVSYPYIATLPQLPVDGAYSGNTLYTLTWDETGGIASATPNYKESSIILEELFPKDKPVFIMCGGGGYAGMMVDLLVFLGWDGQLLYNVGANWEYTGDHSLELVIYPEDADDRLIYATWRADYAYLDFDKMEPLEA